MVQPVRARCTLPEIVSTTGQIGSAQQILQKHLTGDSTVAENAERKRGVPNDEKQGSNDQPRESQRADFSRRRAHRAWP